MPVPQMVGNSRSPSMKNLISPSPNQLLSVCWVQARKVPAYLPRPCTPSRITYGFWVRVSACRHWAWK